MAIGIHIANIKLMNVTRAGVVVDKNVATIGQVANSSSEPRVMEDSSIPNTSGNPSIKDYLELEAGNDYILKHIDQTYIVTYSAADINGA